MGQETSAVRAPTRKRTVRAVPFGAPHVFVLVVVEGPDLESSFKICATETTIGRGDRVNLRLADEEISKRHCTLRCDAGRCHLVDEESLNGTIVNGRTLRPGVTHQLRHLDEIQVGTTRLLFVVGKFTPTPAED